jgi:hypothetical protein
MFGKKLEKSFFFFKEEKITGFYALITQQQGVYFQN